MMAQPDHPPNPTPTRFPPIPLLSGDAFDDADGELRHIATVTVTMTADDGTAKVIPLEYRYGGWWAPDALPGT